MSAAASKRSFPAARLVLPLLLVGLGAFAYTKFDAARAVRAGAGFDGAESAAARFRCDGRTHCSQMTSCEEATFFLRNCLGTQMDGDNDGVPCERQWCTSR